MTRWMRGYRQTKHVCKVARSSTPLQFSGVTIPPDKPAFTWPSVSEIAAIQQVHCKYQPSQTVRSDDGLLTVDGKVWIPGDTADLKLRLLTISHAGAAGHRGADSTFHALREKFYWTDLRNDVRSFVSSGPLCLLSKGNERIPRPLSSMIHAEAPNEILHFDYLFIGESDTDLRYVLVLKDNLSGYCWLEPSTSADAAHAASCLACWIRVFTPPKIWVSDQDSHFKNAVLASLADTHRIRHNFTVAYSPWASGTVESLMRSILSALRALIAEFKLAPHDWASVLPLVMTALNESSLPRLGSRADGLARCPLEVMTGISPARPLHRLFLPYLPSLHNASIDRARSDQLLSITDLQRDLNNMQKEVSRSVSLRRERANNAHNTATNIVTTAFSVGDFVLVRRANDRGHKLRFRWYGPCKITYVHSLLVYSIAPLHDGNYERVHCARLTKYNDSLRGQPVPPNLLDLANRVSSTYENAERIVDIGEGPDGLFFRVQWEGLPDKRDWTWQPIAELYADIPDMVKAFFASYTHCKALSAKVKRQLNLP